MEVIVDGERNFAVEGAPTDLIGAVAAISEFLKAEGRAIVALRADGCDIPPEDLRTRADRPVEDVRVLDVTSGSLADMARNCLDRLEEVVPELARACHALAAVFQGDAPEEGFEPFERLADLWSEVKTQELQVSSLCDLPLEEVRVDGVPAARMHEELNRFLEEAADALRAGDCVLLGDLLEYELAPRAQQECQIVAALRHLAQQPSA